MSLFVPADERIVTTSRTRRIDAGNSRTWSGSKPAPPTSKARAKSASATWSGIPCVCAPTAIIVGEVRGGEVFDMLQAMSTGHDGSIATIHANTPRDSMGRLEMMMLLSGVQIPQRAMRQQIASALNSSFTYRACRTARAKSCAFPRFSGMEGEMVMMQDLFEFRRTGIGPGGEVLGAFGRYRNSFNLLAAARGCGLQTRRAKFSARLSGKYLWTF